MKAQKSNGKGIYVYTVWLDYKHPVLGFGYLSHALDKRASDALRFIQIAELCEAIIGDIDNAELAECVPYTWFQKADAQAIASKIGGYVDMTWKPDVKKKAKRSSG